MTKKANVEAMLKELQEKQIIVAYCCCGTKRTISPNRC